MPRSGKHVNGSSSELPSARIGCVEVIENLVMSQFLSPLCLFGVSVERIWCLFSLSICMMTVSNIHVYRKGVPAASVTVNRPGDVGT